jgi:hypothetical protein
MRLLIIILFCCTAVNGLAQRPWILRTKMTSGPKPNVVSTASSVFVFDTAAMRTFDHGTTWEPISGIVGHVCGVTDFTAGLTLLASYTELDRMVHMYYALGGTAWTQFTEFASNDRPLTLTASATEWYLACENSNSIFVYGDKLETVNMPAGAAACDLKYWDSKLLALDAAKGLYVSTDKGATWKLFPVTGATSIHASSMGVFLATASGVVSVNIETPKVSQVGTWPGRTTTPRITDVESYINSLYAYTDDGAYQMYRLLGQNWEPIGYPLPGTKAARSLSVLAIDAGYAVLAHALSEGFTDSAGVYSYDLNDFTNVDTEMSTSTPYVANNMLFLGSAHADVASIEVWSTTGEKVCDLAPQQHAVPLPDMLRGVYVVRVCSRTSQMPKHVLLVR